MKFDLKKYEGKTFHKDVEKDKKIKALFLLFDHEVYKRELSSYAQLELIDSWIKKFEQHELYEVVPYFKSRRSDIAKDLNVDKTEKVSYLHRLALNLTKLGLKIKNTFKKLFYKK